ncbi:MAG: OsmC family protein [Mariniphaga sp.]|nr:OsmC family protein [Mariniphaga sp.]
MKITISRIDDAYNLKAANENGKSVLLDAAPEIGGGNNGMRPMQLLVSALGGCSTIDIISILKKQRQDLKDIKVELKAEREKDKNPSLFTKIDVHFILIGNVDYSKAQKAVELSMEKYCSVSRILEKTADINYSFEIKPDKSSNDST